MSKGFTISRSSRRQTQSRLEGDSLQDFLNHSFVADCRLAEHPKLGAAICQLDGGRLTYTAATGFAAPLVGRSNAYSDQSIAGAAIARHSVFRHLHTLQLTQPYLFPWEHTIEGLIVVPIGSKTSPLGALLVLSSKRNLLSEDSVDQCLMLAAALAFVWPTPNRPALEQNAAQALSASLKQLLVGASHFIAERHAAYVGTTAESLLGMDRRTFVRLLHHFGVLSNAPTMVRLIEPGPTLVEVLAVEPHFLHSMTPDQLEMVVAERLDNAGFSVRRVGSVFAADGGVDIIAVPPGGGTMVAVQVKHRSTDQPVGRPEVDPIFSKRDRFQAALLVTNNRFSKEAVWASAASRGFLRLRDFDDLVRWIRGHFWSPEEWREMPETVELGPNRVIRVPTPKALVRPEGWPEVEGMDTMKRATELIPSQG